jgi:hypothetical protein
MVEGLQQEPQLFLRLPIPRHVLVRELLADFRETSSTPATSWVRLHSLLWLDATGYFEALTGIPFMLRSEKLLHTWLRTPGGFRSPSSPNLSQLDVLLREAIENTLEADVSPHISPYISHCRT